jgi:FG-GAP repeat protein
LRASPCNSRRGDHWELQQTLAGSTAAGAEFGAAVAIHKDVILVSAPQEDVDVDSNYNLLGAGAGYVYLRKRGGDCNTWTLSQRIRPTASLEMPHGGLGATDLALKRQALRPTAAIPRQQPVRQSDQLPEATGSGPPEDAPPWTLRKPRLSGKQRHSKKSILALPTEQQLATTTSAEAAKPLP